MLLRPLREFFFCEIAAATVYFLVVSNRPWAWNGTKAYRPMHEQHPSSLDVSWYWRSTRDVIPCIPQPEN